MFNCSLKPSELNDTIRLMLSQWKSNIDDNITVPKSNIRYEDIVGNIIMTTKVPKNYKPITEWYGLFPCINQAYKIIPYSTNPTHNHNIIPIDKNIQFEYITGYNTTTYREEDHKDSYATLSNIPININFTGSNSTSWYGTEFRPNSLTLIPAICIDKDNK